MVKRVSTNEKQKVLGVNGSLKRDHSEEEMSKDSVEENGDVSDTDTDTSSVYSGLEESGDELPTSSDESKTDESESDLEDEEVGDIEINPKMKFVEPPKPEINEYDYDSSDEEDIRNTVGNIPMEWYDDYKHLGYDWDGKKIMKPASSDELDNFLSKMDDPNYWRTVNDPMTGRNVILSNRDVELIKQIQKGRYPDKNYDPYAPWSDFFTHETMIHPVTNHPEHKRSFIPSLVEKQKVSRLVYRIKMGRMNLEPRKKEEDDEPKYYLIWDNKDDSVNKRIPHRIPAPKMKLPGHEESYNPPPEYLFTPEEEEKWKNQEPELRKLNFIPRKHSSLREVPAYENFIQERFERCLDLYLCPRQRKMRLNIDPEDLIPKLPKPKDLHPFPTTLTLVYKGNQDKVRCLTVEPYGQFLASGCDDGSVKIYEVLTGRCFTSFKMDGAVKSIAWCPNASICAIAVAVNNNVIILNPKAGDKLVVSNTDTLLGSLFDSSEKAGKSSAVVWRLATDKEQLNGYRMVIEHPKQVKQVTWHCKGDYFATVMSNAANKSVLMHQLTKRHSQEPFRRSKGLVQCVLFHPSRPFFFVATQRYVRIYDLMKQELSKKLMANCKWISSMAVHHAGDNLIVGSYDSRLSWFDLDLSSKPYQTLRHHKKALRQVTYHRRYPLFASASDDASVIVCHGAIYNDFLQNPLLVPVKVLHGHSTKDDLGVLDCQFHPTQPWIFTSGADGNIFLYT